MSADSPRSRLLDRECYPINADGRRIIATRNNGDVVLDPEAPAQKPAHLEFPCPLRPGQTCHVRLAGGPADDGTRPRWQWNGDLERPTLTPSINCLSHNPQTGERYAGCGWHGYITNGEVK